MSNYRTVQDLIIKAAMYDRVSTTIRANELFGGRDVIEIIFTKGDRHSAVQIDILSNIINHEDAILYECKRSLYNLLKAPYEEIEYAKENTK